MLVYGFKDYEGFKELFGMRATAEGDKARKNKVLLSYVKQRELVHQAVFGDWYAKEGINTPTMNALFDRVRCELYGASHGSYYWSLMSARFGFFSDQFKMDDYEGLCEDGDYRAIRYVNAENGRVFKMKSGKFIRRILEESGMLAKLPEQVATWFCEEFANRWQSYAASRLPSYELHVDDDFGKIYSSRYCKGSFGSCMTDRGYHYFYRDAVDAKAAYLTDAEGMVVARCVIFTEVRDEETCEVLRLAERQYSTDGDLILQRCLVDKLIAAGEIDGYKTVGAGCSEAHAFVSKDGEDWSDREFSIRCRLYYGDTLSYQDSFKWYDPEENIAYNTDKYDWDCELDTTAGELEGRNYDSWNERYTDNDTVTVYYHGREYQCDEYDLDEFCYVEYGYGANEYHYEDDCTYCDDIDAYVLDEDAHYSEILDKYYYDEDDMEEDEREYKEEHWTYSEYDDEYYEDADDVTVMVDLDGTEQTISVESAEYLDGYERRDDGKYYEIENKEEEN